ncbi:MAG: exodeoxyribonuclease VII small subunit [Halothiobacillaceae bacterium]|nr:exodeoxyribonuclease VII small subunit [Halothiobacillaceae bacterium]HER34828.1 exodeoxyribonuclease VII small subunit [Halothiobacillaceae bacterium]
MDTSTPPQSAPNQTVETGDPSAITRYEQALAELEQIVARLEAGEQSLEQSLKDYERGMELERQCQRALDEAERRVAEINQPPERTGDDSGPSD